MAKSRTYSQLLQNIESLKRQAEERRKQEIKGVVERIREAIDFYGLTLADLGLDAGGSGAPAGAARYADAAGNTWSGRGPRPRWLREALARGHSLESLRVGSAASAPSSRARKASAKKVRRKSRTTRAAKFRDGAGNSWGGMGKRPQWLREALAAGANLDDFRIDRGTPG